MKRVNNIYNKINDIKKIEETYRKVRTNTKNKVKLERFENNYVSNITYIKKVLENKNYIPGKYNIFIIKKPKIRLIMSQNIIDKTINHIISKYFLIDIFDSTFIDQNIATRNNRGTHYGIKLLKKYLNKIKNNNFYILKFDISKYFFNIDHNIVKKLIRKKIKDNDVLKILDNIIDSTDEEYININIKKLKENEISRLGNKNTNEKIINNIKELPIYKKGKGLPIGNMSSQILAILYGFGEGIKEGIEKLILKYSSEESYDVISDIINGKEISGFSIKNGEISKISTIFGDIDPAKVSLPILSIIIGAIDGFNPCAMWVLIFLITMLFNMKNKKRMWALGITFLITSALVYLLFMFVWLGVATKLLSTASWLKILIGVIALIGSVLNIKGFIKSVVQKDSGCEVVDNTKRKKIMERIKKFTSEKSFLLSLLGVIALAISVNAIELACSAGLPVIFTNVLALNEISSLERCIYIFIYIFFFLLDDLIVFFIAMFTLNIKAISTKYTKYSHLIGGIIMFIIGILMIFKPEWLMFNF